MTDIQQIAAVLAQVEIETNFQSSGLTSCEQIYVKGQSLTSSPSPSPHSGTSAMLASGITAYFTHATYGSSCGYSYSSWHSSTTQYTVGVKAGTPAELLIAANSSANVLMNELNRTCG
jgi:hypothetical protein